MILNEVSRTEYQQKSMQSDDYVPSNQYNGKNRYARRMHQKVDKSISQMNKIDMNKFFQSGILTVNLTVHGETNDYIVTVTFDDVLNQIHNELKRNNDELSLRIIIRAIISAFNGPNIYTRCSCEDFQYRISYNATKAGSIAGTPENRPSNITNPNNSKGLSCKHIQAVLNNNSWIQRVASVIWNYIRYMEKHYEQMYAEIIYPAVYQKPYEDDYQTDLDLNNGEMASSEDDIDVANKWARERNYIQKGWNDENKQEKQIKGQKSFNFNSLVDDDYQMLS